MDQRPAPPRRVRRWIVLAAIVLGSLWIALSGDADLLLGLAMWSLVAVPLAVAGIALARHDWDVGRFFGGGDPYEGHGPD
ncbi:MAG: hypothetical protein JJT89_13345 [Nitriliruptoraceae bacterium]|nr:hypothetical protein [Nitriliruptoraceae bacterium]